MAEPVQTEMRLYMATDFPAAGHILGEARSCDHSAIRATIGVRKVGWLDQQGLVWMSFKDWTEAGSPNGSITPLLIQKEC